MKEVFPNITWAEESKKAMTGTDWQKAEASSIRHTYIAIQNAELLIKTGEDPLKVLESVRGWLTRCLYSCNMENFKERPELRLPAANAAIPGSNPSCGCRTCNACFANDHVYFKMLHDTQPSAWAQAVAIDEMIRDLSQFGMMDECYVYGGCVPLTELARLGFPDLRSAQANECHSGHCFL